MTPLPLQLADPVEREVRGDPRDPRRGVVLDPAPAGERPGRRLLRAVLGLGPPAEHGIPGPVPDGEELLEAVDEVTADSLAHAP